MDLKPKLIIIAGPNGSGKTTITNQILIHEWIKDCIYINPDNIAKEEFGDWNNPDHVLQAAKLSTKMREDCITNQKSLIFETVFSSQDKIDYIIKAKKAGYFIRVFFIGTNHPSINASRITKRVMEKGHDVPIQKIISRYYKSILNCSLISNSIDRLYVYDNSDEYKSASLLFRSSYGKLNKQYSEIKDWAKPIFNSLIP
jgi:predicted ABC-type ATPase